MGSWGTGLYDSDIALDERGDLVACLNELDPSVYLAGVIGVLAWLAPALIVTQLQDDELWGKALRAPQRLANVPEAARRILIQIAEAPEEMTFPGTRLKEHTEVLGGYCDGRRYDELLNASGADEVMGMLLDRAMSRLDELPVDNDLHDHCGMLAPLGVVLELGRPIDRTRLEGWRTRFEQLDAQTDEQRDYWDEFSYKVRRLFELLELQARP